jgi:type IV pilus assembly protein PilO
MPDLRHTRKQLKTTIAILVGVNIVLALAYFSPLIGSAETRRQDLTRLQVELTTKTRAAIPLENLPDKVQTASQQINDFYKDRLPSQNSQIASELGKVAAANGVSIEQERYKSADTQKEPSIPGLEPVILEADLGGNYTAIAKFINALERDQMFFIINDVTLGGDPRGPVKLSVSLETFLKVGS